MFAFRGQSKGSDEIHLSLYVNASLIKKKKQRDIWAFFKKVFLFTKRNIILDQLRYHPKDPEFRIFPTILKNGTICFYRI